MAGIAQNHGMNALAVGGIAHHAHALLNLGVDPQHRKSRSGTEGQFIPMDEFDSGTRFEWQEGYFASCVSQSQVATILGATSRTSGNTTEGWTQCRSLIFC